MQKSQGCKHTPQLPGHLLKLCFSRDPVGYTHLGSSQAVAWKTLPPINPRGGGTQPLRPPPWSQRHNFQSPESPCTMKAPPLLSHHSSQEGPQASSLPREWHNAFLLPGKDATGNQEHSTSSHTEISRFKKKPSLPLGGGHRLRLYIPGHVES
jgi:hypothetical protein